MTRVFFGAPVTSVIEKLADLDALVFDTDGSVYEPQRKGSVNSWRLLGQIGASVDPLELGANPAQSGAIRLSAAQATIKARAIDDSGDIEIAAIDEEGNLRLLDGGLIYHEFTDNSMDFGYGGAMRLNVSSFALDWEDAAQTGFLRLPNGENGGGYIGWRTWANDGDILIGIDGDDHFNIPVLVDLASIPAGQPNLRVTPTNSVPGTSWTNGTPDANPAGFIEINTPSQTKYIPYWT